MLTSQIWVYTNLDFYNHACIQFGLQIALRLVRQEALNEPPAAEVKAEGVQELKETFVVGETQSEAELVEDSNHELATETSTTTDAVQEGEGAADSKVFLEINTSKWIEYYC